MRVRRAATVMGAVAALVLFGGPAWSDETPAPEPTAVVSDDDVQYVDVPVEGDPYCFSSSPAPAEEPTGGATEPAPEPTAEPTDGATDEATPEPTVEASADPTDEPTDNPSGEPTPDPDPTLDPDPSADPSADPSGAPDPSGEPVGYIVCASGASAGGLGDGEATLGAGAPQLPTTGAPLGPYAATGLALVLAGAGTVLLVGRRTA